MAEVVDAVGMHERCARCPASLIFLACRGALWGEYRSTERSV